MTFQGRLLFRTLTALLAPLTASATTVAGRVADHDFTVKSEGRELVLTYTNPEGAKLEEWRKARLQKVTPEGQAGDRAAWKTEVEPVAGVARDGEKRVQTIRLVVGPQVNEQWSDALGYADREVLDAPEVKRAMGEFFLRNAREIDAAAKRVPKIERSWLLGEAKDLIDARRTARDKRTKAQAEKIASYQNPKRESFAAPFDLKRNSEIALDKHGLLAVHHYRGGGDKCGVTTAELDALMDKFKEKKRPVVFLATNGHISPESWVGSRRDPDETVYSFSGEHDVPVRANEVTLTGGFLGMCLSTAAQESIRQHFRESESALQIHIPMAAAFVNMPAQVAGQKDCMGTVEDYYKRLGPKELARKLIQGQSRDDLFGVGGNYAWGKLDPKDYTLEFYIDGHPAPEVEPVGSGKKKVRVQFWSRGQHPVFGNKPNHVAKPASAID